MPSRYYLPLLAAGCSLLAGQLPQVSGPVLGYVNTGGTLRTVLGVPGAAYFGPSLDTGGVQPAAVSSSRSYALILSDDNKTATLIHLSSGSTSALAQFDEPVTYTRLSPLGDAIALVHGGVCDVFTGLPANVVKTAAIEVAAGSIAAGISDDGQAVLFNAGGIARLWTAGEWSDIGAGVQAAAFRPRSRDLVLVRDGTISLRSSAGTVETIASTGDVSENTAAYLSRDGQSAFLAGNGRIAVIDLPRHSTGIIDLPCAATDAEPVDGALRVSCSDSTYLLRTGDSEPRLFFVPRPTE